MAYLSQWMHLPNLDLVGEVRELQLNRIEIRAAIGNVKSQAIPEKLGFAKEGCVREAEWLYDHYVDHIIYGMLKSDFTKLYK